MTSRLGAIGILVWSVLTVGATPAAEDASEHRAAVEEWRQERHERLRDPEGWLSLVGLYWLQPGANSFGSGEQADLRFPEGAPSRMGVLHLDDGHVSVEPAEGVRLAIGDTAIRDRHRLAADDEAETTVVAWESLRFFVIRRGERLGIRLKDRKSTLLESFTGMESYPIDASWRFDAAFEPYEPPKPVDVPNVLGTIDQQGSPGRVRFERDGQSFSLDALPASEGRLFLIFADDTNGEETYGGGRFLYAGPPADGRVEVDFNRAYNPPCVFTPYATCPLPPRQNRLPIAVTAGELAFHGGVEH